MTAQRLAQRLINWLSTDRQADTRRAEDLIAHVIALEPDNYRVYFAKSFLSATQMRPEEALAEAERALALNPSYVQAYIALAIANLFLSRPEKALEIDDRAIRLSPHDPLLSAFYAQKGLAYSALSEGAKAIDWHRRTLALNPHYVLAQLNLISELALNGHEAEAREMLKRYLSASGPRVRTLAQRKAFHYAFSDNPAYRAWGDRLVEGLRKAGMPEQ
jgi:adenylate cyclase